MKICDSLANKNDNPIEKINLSLRYKKYRNLIVTLLRRSRENYFKSYFEKNKNDVKKTWNGIRTILAISKKKTTSIDQLNYKNKILFQNLDKANVLNDFFTNIGANVEEKIPKSQQSFQHYLKNRNILNIIHQPCDLYEIREIIKEFSVSKACGPYSIPTSLLKSTCTVLAPVLLYLINKSLITGKFPNVLKLANICPILKKK